MDALYTQLIEKQKVLHKAATTLNQEFAGLHGVIGQIIGLVSPWYLFPHMQERPLVINLWGLTGVGKSSLVERLAQLLDFADNYYHFDLGETVWGSGSIKNSLEDIYSHANGFPAILAFDEFQHARTLSEMGAEMKKPEQRVVWQLLDSGKFQFPRGHYFLENLYSLIQKLQYILNSGVDVRNGVVVKKQDFYMQIMTEYREHEDPWEKSDEPKPGNPIMFFPESNLERLFEFAREEYTCIPELKKDMLSMDGAQTIAFLQKVFTLGNSPKIVDCSKTLIFVMGNLDEVYNMSTDFNPDKDADEFHEQSLKINLPQVKQALRRRFRNEQIARLGNNHIIYPAFSRKTYEEIICLELDKISRKVQSMQNIRMHFAPSLCHLIYREGVYPSQGTRPVFSTIHQLVSSKLAQIFSEMVLKRIETTDITLEGDTAAIKAVYCMDSHVQHVLYLPHQLNLEKLREEKCDDMQAISAVHESGHAIVSAILLKTLPELIFSSSLDSDTAGFVFGKFKWKYVSRKEILPRLALLLAGFAAEKIVFGEENITTGAEEDIAKATTFITDMLKSCGLGGFTGAYHAEGAETRSFLYDSSNKINAMAEEYLAQALELAERTLKKQETLLIYMADYLSDRRQLLKTEFRSMLQQYAVDFDMLSLVENGDLLFYRNHLKQKLKEAQAHREVKLPERKGHEWALGL